jgi:hypothetical protein
LQANDKGGDFCVKEHYNIYYLFAEDKKRHQMPDDKKEKILKNLQEFFKNIKPP